MLSRKLNPRWTIEKADAAMLAEAELIKIELTHTRVGNYLLNEIEREYQFYDVKVEWPES